MSYGVDEEWTTNQLIDTLLCEIISMLLLLRDLANVEFEQSE